MAFPKRDRIPRLRVCIEYHEGTDLRLLERWLHAVVGFVELVAHNSSVSLERIPNPEDS